MTENNLISVIEHEIDEAFANNPLVHVHWAQSAWTLLSVVEDHFFKITVIDPLSDREFAMYVDGLVNWMTYPLRVLHERAPRTPTMLDRRLIDEHYGLAQDWICSANDYTQFCSIFPLYHNKEINLTANGDYLEPSDWSQADLSFEAYDRLVGKREPQNRGKLDSTAVVKTLRACISASGRSYSVNFNRQLLTQLQRELGQTFEGRHALPDDWQFTRFSLAQYRAVFTCLQICASAWYIARQIVAPGMTGIAYQSAAWLPRKGVLVKLLARHTELSSFTVQSILDYLTFGNVGIRNPDIAIQPLVDLRNDHYCISPFVMTQIHAERNLCVLLNQVPDDRIRYAALVNEKEALLRTETIQSLQELGFDFRHGEVGSTDIDLAIIDHASKVCLCIELKWFIEPAEIREVLMRSKELQKGVVQVKTLQSLFANNDSRLLALLGINQEYEFQAIVGSVNFIGRPNIQDSEVPIVKLWHAVARLQEIGSLSALIQWLRRREYLPTKNLDFVVHERPIVSGRWKSRWYGIAHASNI